MTHYRLTKYDKVINIAHHRKEVKLGKYHFNLIITGAPHQSLTVHKNPLSAHAKNQESIWTTPPSRHDEDFPRPPGRRPPRRPDPTRGACQRACQPGCMTLGRPRAYRPISPSNLRVEKLSAYGRSRASGPPALWPGRSAADTCATRVVPPSNRRHPTQWFWDRKQTLDLTAGFESECGRQVDIFGLMWAQGAKGCAVTFFGRISKSIPT